MLTLMTAKANHVCMAAVQMEELQNLCVNAMLGMAIQNVQRIWLITVRNGLARMVFVRMLAMGIRTSVFLVGKDRIVTPTSMTVQVILLVAMENARTLDRTRTSANVILVGMVTFVQMTFLIIVNYRRASIPRSPLFSKSKRKAEIVRKQGFVHWSLMKIVSQQPVRQK